MDNNTGISLLLPDQFLAWAEQLAARPKGPLSISLLATAQSPANPEALLQLRGSSEAVFTQLQRL